MTDAPDKATAEDPLIGATLGGYEIRRLIGRGGYANVYLAMQTRLEREVALKVLREDGTGVNPDQVEAFWREARAAATFNHPCLVHVHDVGECDGSHFLSMELVRGGNLARLLRTKGPMPWRDVIMVGLDVVESRCSTLGQHVSIEVGARTLRGRAESLDPNGALLLRTDHGRLERVTGGDVLILDT